jgi:hypothetical protein
MRPLEFDFLHDGPRPRPLGWLLLVAGLAVAAGAAWRYEAVQANAAEVDAVVRRTRQALRQPAPVPLSAAESRQAVVGARRASEVVQQLNVPWNTLFATLESASTPDAVLLAIESDSDKRKVRITAEARDLKAMLAFLKVLEGQPALAGVQLQTHGIQQQDPQRPVRFSLAAVWVERK